MDFQHPTGKMQILGQFAVQVQPRGQDIGVAADTAADFRLDRHDDERTIDLAIQLQAFAEGNEVAMNATLSGDVAAIDFLGGGASNTEQGDEQAENGQPRSRAHGLVKRKSPVDHAGDDRRRVAAARSAWRHLRP